jgi:adenylylsulfate kinase
MVRVKGRTPLPMQSTNFQCGLTVWFTGLSGAGKSTLSQAIAALLRTRHFKVAILDVDELRRTLCADLGFSRQDREENVFRIASVAEQLTREQTIALVAVIAPYRSVRAEVRRRIGSYFEVFVDAPLSVCMQRDPKGLYVQAQRGEIPCFTGISDPYESPVNPEIVCHTDAESIDESSAKVLAAILDWQRALNASRHHDGAGSGS